MKKYRILAIRLAGGLGCSASVLAVAQNAAPAPQAARNFPDQEFRL
jgi:hypothetical protein